MPRQWGRLQSIRNKPMSRNGHGRLRDSRPRRRGEVGHSNAAARPLSGRLRSLQSLLMARLVISGMLVLLTAGWLVAETQSWELHGDRWQPVDEASPERQAVEPVPELDRAQELIERGRHKAAKDHLVRWLNSPAGQVSLLRDRGLFLLAEAYYRYGDRIRAFYHLDELMDFHPASPLYAQALQRQYDIADAFLRGYKMRFLGIPLLSGEDYGIEMLFRIQQRSPGSPLAEKSLLRTADYYYADSQFDLAEDTYAAYVRSYPRSPLIPRARLRQAFSSYAQFRGLRFDATPLVDARTQLVELTAQYPALAEEENLREFVDRIDSTFARKLLVTADFYERTNEDGAAAYYYRFVLQAYPGRDEAVIAQQRLEALPASAREAPAPPAEDIEDSVG